MDADVVKIVGIPEYRKHSKGHDDEGSMRFYFLGGVTLLAGAILLLMCFCIKCCKRNQPAQMSNIHARINSDMPMSEDDYQPLASAPAAAVPVALPYRPQPMTQTVPANMYSYPSVRTQPALANGGYPALR